MPLFSKKERKKATRLYFATDLHGSERTYRKFINAGKFYDVDILVMGGDITGKLLIPIIKENNDHYRATLQGRVEKITTQNDLENFITRLGTLGFYHKVMEDEDRVTVVRNVGWALWAAIQANISKINYDFWGWAVERWGRAVKKMDSPEFPVWLQSVQT
jgi:Icc-related predicted phosphoesterase